MNGEHIPDTRPGGALELEASLYGAWNKALYMVTIAVANGHNLDMSARPMQLYAGSEPFLQHYLAVN